MKRNKTKSFFDKTYGKNIRYFMLDFQCQKLYYKNKESDSRIKFVCSFNQIEGVSSFFVNIPKIITKVA